MNFETIARPYAQAIYDHSQGWETDLDQLELALETPEVQRLIDSPKLAYKEKTEVFLSLFEGQIQDKTSSFRVFCVVHHAIRMAIHPRST